MYFSELIMLRIANWEAINPRPCFQPLKFYFSHFCNLLLCCFYLLRKENNISTIQISTYHTNHQSIHQTSASKQSTILLGVLGTQELLVP